jgi:hypothetical protein
MRLSEDAREFDAVAISSGLADHLLFNAAT